MSNAEESIIEVEMPEYLFDDWIVSDFGTFQTLNRRQPSDRLRIDFSNCKWFSPMPLLVLSAEIATHSHAGRSIDIDLGAGGTSASSDEEAAMRRYMATHGFLEGLASRADLAVRFQFDTYADHGDSGLWFHGREGATELRGIFDRFGPTALHGTTCVLPAAVWELPSSDDPNLSHSIRVYVENLLREADRSLFKFRTEARKYRDTTLQRLNQTILELAENASEHAYLGQRKGYAALYARFRSTDTELAKTWRRREISSSPLLGSFLTSAAHHQIELFFVDVGRGLFADIANWKVPPSIKASKQPLRETTSYLFRKSVSRHDRADPVIADKKGLSTGLLHLDAILGHKNDRTRISNGNEWVVGPHPREDGFAEGARATGGYRQFPTFTQGAFFHVGLSPSEIPALDALWFSSEARANHATRQAIIRTFGAQGPRAPKQSRVIDIRGGEGGRNVSEEVRRASSAVGTVVRVNRVAEKNLLNQILKTWIETVSELNVKNPVLYLCDLGRYQALDAVWITSRFTINVSSPIPTGASIFVVTEDLCCSEFALSSVDLGASQFRIRVERISVRPERLVGRICFLLEELRASDSIGLWRRIRELSAQAPDLLIENVLWSDGPPRMVLPHYLNFAILVQDPESARYVRRSLRRLLALFPESIDQALDQLVEASLHDAKKWLIRPGHEVGEQVLIGSLSISGCTLARQRNVPNRTVAGIIDCVASPYFTMPPSATIPHLFALLWGAPPTQLPMQIDPVFRRLGKTGFVQPISSEPLVQEAVAHDIYERLNDSDVLKVGHWKYGDRHSLLELNAELVLEESGASESGAIPWLVKQVQRLCKSGPVVLSFPVHRLAYRLAHHVALRVRKNEVGPSYLTLLPLSYLPRFAGGISRFSPLVMEAARRLASHTPAHAVAVFLDIGFFTNRTLRHSVRQLHAAGFDEVHPLGVLNRSTAPDFRNEREEQQEPFSVPIPRAYWRWSVPTLGSSHHCAMCASLSALARLRRVITDAHPDLIPFLEQVGENWSARDVADYWEEYGLSPMMIAPEALAAIRDQFPELTGHPLPSTSVSVASRVIERLRTSGDPEIPILVAQRLSKLHPGAAVELLSIVLLLAGSSLTQPDLHDYVLALAKAAIEFSAQPANEQPSDDMRARLLGLVALVFALQNTSCKLAILTPLAHELDARHVSHPVLRLALIALTSDSDQSTRVESTFFQICSVSRDSVLARNYQAIRPSRATVRDTWDQLVQAFGRSERHSQTSVLGELTRHLQSGRDAKSAIKYIDLLGSLLGNCDQQFARECLDRPLSNAITQADEVRRSFADGSIAPAVALERVRETFNGLSTQLHECLSRFGGKRSLIYNNFYDFLSTRAAQNGLVLLRDIVIPSKFTTIEWPEDVGSDYLALCGQVRRLFDELFSNIKHRAILGPPPENEPACSDAPGRALAWLWFDTTREALHKGLTLVLVNGIEPTDGVGEYRSKIALLKEFGVVVTTEGRVVAGERTYYKVSVRIPSLGTILEMS